MGTFDWDSNHCPEKKNTFLIARFKFLEWFLYKDNIDHMLKSFTDVFV
jgi:hypothetical protein